MNKYEALIERLVEWGGQADGLCAAFVVGSQAREERPADEYSDLDVVLVVGDPEMLIHSDRWLRRLGDFHISFVEDTLGGGKERRVLFEDGLDVDFVLMSPAAAQAAFKSGEGAGILERGYRLLIDKVGLFAAPPSEKPEGSKQASEQAYQNAVHDFWYHTVWTAKKLLRGERWTAKMCLDSYMKGRLLWMIEWHARAAHGPSFDTWHSGRFLDDWAEKWILERLPECFAQYDDVDMRRALRANMALFRMVAVELAELRGFEYPREADACATRWVEGALGPVGH